eukprot:3936168-Rhodomonas_salina.1
MLTLILELRLRQQIIDLKVCLTNELKDFILNLADKSLLPLAVPPSHVAKIHSETGERTETVEFPFRLYFTEALRAPPRSEAVDLRRYIPTPLRHGELVMEAVTQLLDENCMRQHVHGQMLALTRGEPGTEDDPMMLPALGVIPPGHKGKYLDNLEYIDREQHVTA